MGGHGSGRHFERSNRPYVEHSQRLCISDLNRDGFLMGNCSLLIKWYSGDNVQREAELSVSDDGSVIVCFGDHQLNVGLTTTECHFGGYRYWWLCPLCERRCGVVYWEESGLVCQQWVGLAYKSENESDIERLRRKIRKVGRKIGAPDNLIEAPTVKPKYMRARTYVQLLQKYENLKVRLYSSIEGFL